MVKISTSLGDITVELFHEDAPVSTANFLRYVKEGHYDGTIFHRVIDGFMVQGGGFDMEFYNGNIERKPTHDPIDNEATNGLRNERGTLAMARTAVVDSATSQFFINVADNDFLNHRGTHPQDFGYCVFGRVVGGMDVVDEIKGVATTALGGMKDVPQEPVQIFSVTPVEKNEPELEG